ncbi:MAG: hypothetical protein HC923_09900 [Myxococcales bacterium]|nr:hypothetical protein [Myxococcales bacterium]
MATVQPCLTRSAVSASIGASFAGHLALTGSSGPGIALKQEAIGLAVATELPLVVLNVQRAGPSTGLPTKTEQADLLQALFGRNGECPVVVVAPATPSECFDIMFEAFRLALRAMVPVFVLSDGFLANGSEPWRIPDVSALPRLDVRFHEDRAEFHPYRRDPVSLARIWAKPGTPGLEHRIGGIEKGYDTGHISYDPENHQHMVQVREEKIARLADILPALEIDGPEAGPLLVVGWGSTFGSIRQAVRSLRSEGRSVSHVHLRHLNPLPNDLGTILKRFERVVVPELNLGQLTMVLRARYLIDAVALSKVKGRPFMVDELVEALRVFSPQSSDSRSHA